MLVILFEDLEIHTWTYGLVTESPYAFPVINSPVKVIHPLMPIIGQAWASGKVGKGIFSPDSANDLL